jgi:hypothetical protein
VEREVEREEKPQGKRGQIEIGLESLVHQYGIEAVIDSLNQLPDVGKKA